MSHKRSPSIETNLAILRPQLLTRLRNNIMSPIERTSALSIDTVLQNILDCMVFPFPFIRTCKTMCFKVSRRKETIYSYLNGTTKAGIKISYSSCCNEKMTCCQLIDLLKIYNYKLLKIHLCQFKESLNITLIDKIFELISNTDKVVFCNENVKMPATLTTKQLLFLKNNKILDLDLNAIREADEEALRHLKNIKTLNFNSNSFKKVTDDDLKLLANITHLNCDPILEEKENPIFSDSLEELSLRIKDTFIGDNPSIMFKDRFTNLSKLRKLMVNFQIDHFQFDYFRNLEKVEVPCITKECLQKMTNLKEFILSHTAATNRYNPYISRHVRGDWFDECKQLEIIRMNKYVQFDDNDFKHFSQLKIIELELIHEPYEHKIRCLKNIEELILRGDAESVCFCGRDFDCSHKLPLKGIWFEDCTKLKKLKISDSKFNYRIEDEDLKYIGKNLQELILSENTHITPEGFKYLPVIRNLEISRWNISFDEVNKKYIFKFKNESSSPQDKKENKEVMHHNDDEDRDEDDDNDDHDHDDHYHDDHSDEDMEEMFAER